MFRLAVKSPGRWGPQQKRAPRADTHLPDGRPVDTVPKCPPLGIASLLLGLDRSVRCGFHCNRGYVEEPPPSPHPVFPLPRALGLIPPSPPSLQRQHQTSIRRHRPRINSPRGTVALDRVLGHEAEDGMMSRGIRGYSWYLWVPPRWNHPSTVPPSQTIRPNPGLVLDAPLQTLNSPFGRMETGVGERSPDLARALPHVPFAAEHPAAFFWGADVGRLRLEEPAVAQDSQDSQDLFSLALAKRPRIFEFIEPRAQTGHTGRHHRRQHRLRLVQA